MYDKDKNNYKHFMSFMYIVKDCHHLQLNSDKNFLYMQT